MTARLVARSRARAVLILYLSRATSALVLSYPVAKTTAAFLPPAFPSADALLFAPGGFHAAEAMRLGGRAIQASLEGSALGFVLIAIVLSAPFAVAISALVRPAEPLPSLAKHGAQCTPSLVAIAGATAFAQAVGLAAIAGAVGAASGSLDRVLDERQADLTLAGLALVASSSLLVLGLAADLSRAAIVRHGVRARRAVVVAFGVLRRAPFVVASAWLPPALAGIAVVAVAAFVASRLDVSRPGAARVWGIALLHQGVVLAIVMLRVYWLERALAIVGPGPAGGRAAAPLSEPPTPSPAYTPGRSAGPDDPTPDPAA